MNILYSNHEVDNDKNEGSYFDFSKEYDYKSFCKGLEKPSNVNIIDSDDSDSYEENNDIIYDENQKMLCEQNNVRDRIMSEIFKNDGDDLIKKRLNAWRLEKKFAKRALKRRE